MDQPKSVSINGRQYDLVTGLPIGDDTSAMPPVTKAEQEAIKRAIHAGNIHTITQKSKTLRRASLKRPEAMTARTQQPIHRIQTHKQPIHQPVTKSSQVTRFASHDVARVPRMMDISPVKHHLATKAQQAVDAKRVPEPVKPAQVLKQEIMQHAIENTSKHTKQHKQRGFRHPRAASIVTASVALFILGGYLTYLNMPSLSVRVAAAAAGVNASYPNYRPDGYQLSGPVAYDKGQVSLRFAANAGPQAFTVKQTKSSWDSAAVLDNYVMPKAGSDYATYSERGLTIYTFDGGVAWVNGGVLYTVEGNAPLSSEQIRHLATSFI